jgi:hypothetical protein
MATPLKDFRLGITEQIDAALDAQAAAFGKDKAAVARDVLGEWARLKHREHTLYGRRLASNGMQLDLAGIDLEDDGGRRK